MGNVDAHANRTRVVERAYGGVRFTEGRGLRAGEYVFPAGISAEGVVGLLRSGRTVVRRITVPEGLTSAQIVALLAAEPALSGETPPPPPEGQVIRYAEASR